MSQNISILKEIRQSEQRVILQPSDVARFVERGFCVHVETGASLGSGFSDSAYAQTGAKIVSKDAAWQNSDLIFKYKAPDSSEFRYFRKNLSLACFMHAEGNIPLTRAMQETGMHAFALEFFKTQRQDFPVPVSDNEISGKLAVLMAAYHLQNPLGG